MDTSRALSLFLVTTVFLRGVFAGNLEFMLTATALAVGSLCMIWFADFFAEYWLGFGFWESKAKDFKQAHRQGPVIAFLGWLALIAVILIVFLANPDN